MKRGFTLAEVLITLAVIGVVAALAIPSLIQNTNDAQYKTAWKKTYADIGQSVKMIMINNAGSLKGAYSTHNTMKDSFLEHMSYIKACNLGDVYGDNKCWHGENKSYNIDGSYAVWSGTQAGAVLSNGTLLLFGRSGCTASYGLPVNCGWIYVDVNGFKDPNKISKDIFATWITDTAAVPMGFNGDSHEKSDLTTYGLGYSAKYLYSN